MAQSPLHQFEVHKLIELPTIGGYHIDFTNASLWMMIAMLGAYLFLFLGMGRASVVPGRFQSLVEMTYDFIAGTVRDNVGPEGKAYFPFIFTLFMFILTANLLGMVPYSFTVTSHIIVTFALAMLVFVGVTLIALIKHGRKFFGFFLPHGTPWWMAPVMYFIELFSYLARPVSLSVRLAANMMAGHTMLKVIAGFAVTLPLALGAAGWGLNIVPVSFLTVLTGFEIGIAILQAYIFTVLTCVYLNDALHLH